MRIEVGTKETATAIVDETNIASAVGSGLLPVFATPSMVALMEKAACACLDAEVGDGQTSVGTRIDIEHIAASPVGANITAMATVTAIDGRLREFEVVAFEGEKQIGKGIHTRVIVNSEKFLSKLKSANKSHGLK
ncbi:MAG: thioesterase family protein [Clostridiales bacterium]|jgi:predicted thioesterase|nr:thioesterase family protein [Clostridiales bacterium]